MIQHDGLFYISAGSGVYAAAVTGGTPQLLASGVRPTDMAVHGTDLVFADDLGGAVYRVPLSGGGAEFIATATMPSNMVVGGDYAYWRESGSHIYRALASGGPTELVHTKINDTLLGPKVNGATSDIYFLDADFIGGGVHYNARRIQPGSSGSSPAGGATLLGGSALWDVHGTTLWLGETGTLFSVYSRLYVPPGTPAPPFGAPARVTTYASRILVDDESLFDSDDASLFESKLCNGFTTELARGLAGYMIADADYLYWLSGSTLRRVPRYGRP
ncbi:MAG: hypothetical protein R3B72_18310 [Polyangiaceae bacterium]